jgi:fibronectin type 3 domain-containing protein
VERRPAAEEGGFAAVGTVKGLEFSEGGTSESPLADSTGYVYRVWAENRVGAVGPPSVEVPVVTRPPPAPVTGLTATGDELRCVPLLWNPSPEADVVAYDLYRSSGEEESDLLATVKGRDGVRYLDGGGNPGHLADATRYVYRVVAVNGVGARSVMSEPVAAVTRDRPPRVSGFEAVSGQPRRVELAWVESEDEKVDGYHLFRAEGDGAFGEIARVEGRGVCRFADDGDHQKKLFGGEEVVPLKDGTRYRYRILAVNPAGAVSEVPSEADAVTKAVPPTPSAPEVVSGLAGRMEIRWKPAEGNDVGGYVLMAGDGEGEMTDLMRLEGVTAEEKGLEPGRTRVYALRVVDLDGLESAPSARVAGTTKALPDPPSELVTEGLTLAWNAPRQRDVVKYRIWEKKFLGKKEWGETEETMLTFAAEDIGKKKVFLVQSVDADGQESGLSEPVEVRP